MEWIDAHNHLQDSRLENQAGVISAMLEAGVTKCVVNATKESDWNAVTVLSEKYPDLILPAYGIHPWHADTTTSGWQDRLADLLERNPTATIGECGLDQWISTPSIATQTPVFRDQIALACQLDRTATIHCLRAWEPLFDVFQETPPPSRFLMHSFGGSLEIARRLLPFGAYFSFSGYFLQPRKSKVLEVYRSLPPDRILVETDAPDMMPPVEFVTHPLADTVNHPANLASIACALGKSLNLPPNQLSEQISANFRRCFP